MDKYEYRTIKGHSTGIYKDKGSKFIAYAYPISHFDEVKQFVDILREEHKNARHFCFAWRLGANGERYRQNDDGEPSGSAGRPIYGQLVSLDLTNVLVVVVRYFGGTLLGVPGLINAYKSATTEALEESEIIIESVKSKYILSFDYIVMNDVMKILKKEKIQIQNPDYEMVCKGEIEVRIDKESSIVTQLRKLDSLIIAKI